MDRLSRILYQGLYLPLFSEVVLHHLYLLNLFVRYRLHFLFIFAFTICFFGRSFPIFMHILANCAIPVHMVVILIAISFMSIFSILSSCKTWYGILSHTREMDVYPP